MSDACNFTLYMNLHRYITRCLLIEFKHPRLQTSMKKFEELTKLMESLSSAAGFMISLGKKFTKEIVADLDSSILPELKKRLGENVLPRTFVGYGILIWFVKQVCMLTRNLMCTAYMTRSIKKSLIVFINCQICLIISPREFKLSPSFDSKPYATLGN